MQYFKEDIVKWQEVVKWEIEELRREAVENTKPSQKLIQNSKESEKET